MTPRYMHSLRSVSQSAKASSRMQNPLIRQPTSNSLQNGFFPKQVRYASCEASACTTSSTPTPPAANPFILSRHGDFNKIQASRKPFEVDAPVTTSRTPAPDWKYGSGVNNASGQHHSHVEIDPNGPGRTMAQNYKLLIAGIPRPISFVSTVSKDGNSRNLAPFSYFQVVDHDPPIFVIGFSGRPGPLKDTRRNLLDTGECVISVVSEHMIEAVNATSLDVPHGMSEWEISGLRAATASTVKAQRVEDAVFSIEGKLLEMKELSYHDEQGAGKPTGALAIIEGTRFWVREDAVNQTRDGIDLQTLRPLVQLGGISYGRVRETFELPRGSLQEELKKPENGLARILHSQQCV